MSKNVKIVFTVPIDAADRLRQAIADAGIGKIGNYDSCSFSSRGTGRFRPLTGAKPSIGQVGKIEEVEEERIETICPHEKLDEAIGVIKEAHPYEVPAIDVYSLEDIQ